MKQPDVVGHHQIAAQLVPARTVANQRCVGARGHPRADFGKMQVHHFGVCCGCEHCSPDAPLWTYGTKNIGRVMAVIAYHERPCADRCPNISVGALLADAGFVLDPDFDRRPDDCVVQGLPSARS